jgi:hypothetical protein
MKRIVSGLLVGLLCLVVLSIAVQADPADHQDQEPRPIPLGISGGNVNDRSLISCCSGTLGALVNVGGQFHILSNNHVLARSNRGKIGDPINQPGNIDVGCQVVEADFVADLSGFEPISFSSDNTIDAAIAQIRSGQVRTDGFILDIGVPSSSPLEASIGLGVKKSGRSTGLTTGQISAINVTVSVEYCPRCVPHCWLPRMAQFVGQIAITPGTFSAGGDSGALIVENVDNAPRPVALLFAGSPELTIGSPIGLVLSAFGATLVGTTASPTGDTSAVGGTAVSEQELAAATAIQQRHQAALMRIPGVVGVGIGRSAHTGQLVLRVFLDRETPEVRQSLPAFLEGLGVETVVTGSFEARTCVDQSPDEP